MANQLYYAIRKWAPRNVEGTLARRLRRDITVAWANNNSKAKKRFEFLYRLGEFDNLPNAVRSIRIEDRVKTDVMQSCWMCGTRHADGYRAHVPGDREHFIGHDCGRILAGYGLGTGVILEQDKKSAARKRQSVQDDLEGLVLDEGKPFAFLHHSGPVKETSPDYLGSQLAWISKQQLPQDVRLAVQHLKDPYYKTSRSDVKLVVAFIAENRTFPSDAYMPVMKDLWHMEHAGVIKDTAAKLEKKVADEQSLTVAEAKRLLDGIPYADYRIARNSELLTAYEEPLASIINDLLPALKHDKPLWHHDHVHQHYLFNKVLNQSDYRLAKGCLNRWTFGRMDTIAGADKHKLRNIAVRMECVYDFKDQLEGLVVMQRKLRYARDNTTSEEYTQLGLLQQSIGKLPEEMKAKVFKDACAKAYEMQKEPVRLLQEPCITIEHYKEQHPEMDIGRTLDIAGKVHARGFLNNFQRTYLPHLKEHLAYGLLRKEDAPRLAKAAELMKGYVRA
ncbi:MAG TPA: hypothetical protein VLJ21_02790 [Candidatus Binatia bacterium]|nr:hypothetical protein [Candidatus Binatia bacterium]